MFCNDPKLWILGADNLFSQVGWSLCSQSWAESILVGSFIALWIFAIANILRGIRGTFRSRVLWRWQAFMREKDGVQKSAWRNLKPGSARVWHMFKYGSEG